MAGGGYIHPSVLPGPRGTLAKPRGLEEAFIPAPELEKKQTEEQLTTLSGNFAGMMTRAQNLIDKEMSITDDDLLGQAESFVDAEIGTLRQAPRPDYKVMRMVQKFESLKKLKDRESLATRTALWEAAKKGALLNIGDVSDIDEPELRIIAAMARDADPSRLPEILSGREDLLTHEEMMTRILYEEKGIPEHIPTYMKPLHAIATGGRMMQAGGAGGLLEFHKQAEAMPPLQKIMEEHVPGFSNLPPGAQQAIADAMQRGVTGIEKDVGAVGEKVKGVGHALETRLKERTEERGLVAPQLGPKLIAEGLKSFPIGETIMGVPAGKAVATLASSKAEIMRESARSAIEGISFEQHAALQKVLEGIAEELGPEAVEKDVFAIALKHPVITQMAVEMALDPANLVGAWMFKFPLRMLGMGAKGAGKLAMKIPKVAEAVEKVAPAARKLKQVVTWMPEAKAVEKAGFQEMADKMILAEAEAVQPQRRAMAVAERAEGLGKLSGSGFFRKHPEKKALVQKALDGELFAAFLKTDPSYDDLVAKLGHDPAALEAALKRGGGRTLPNRALLPEELRPAFDEAQAMGKEMWDIGEEAGVHQIWKEGELLAGKPREPWVPHAQMTPEELAKLDALRRASSQDPKIMGRAEIAAAHARKAPPEAFVQDPGVQFKKSAEELARKAAPAAELKGLQRYLGSKKAVHTTASPHAVEEGVILRVHRNQPEPERLKMLADLEKQTPGMKWKAVQQSLADVHLQVTGKPGLSKGKYDLLAPEPLVQRMEMIAPIVVGGKTRGQAIFEGIETVLSYSVRPFMNAFRRGTVILGGPYPIVKNMVGAFGLGYVAHGFRIIDPTILKPAVIGAMLSGGLGSKSSRAMKIPLASGKEKTLGWALDTADRLTIINQAQMRLGLEGKGRGPLSWILEKPLQKISEVASPIYLPIPTGKPWKAASYQKLSAQNIFGITEDFQHFISFLGFLTDDTPEALGRALQLTAKFSGDYRRLSMFERYVIKDLGAFYSWNRFVLPHYATQLAENPARTNKFIQGRLAMWRAGDAARAKERGYKRPPEEAISGYLKLAAVPAPPSQQPQRSKLPDIGTRDYTLMTIEDIHTMGGAFIPILQSIGGEAGQLAASEQMSPIVMFLVEALSGRDFHTNEPIQPFGWDSAKLAQDLGFMAGVSNTKRSALAKLMVAPVRRSSRNLSNVFRLYAIEADKPMDSADMQLRYRVGNDFRLFAHAFNMSAELIHGHEIPGAIVPTWPGTGQYPVDVTKKTAAASSRAVRELPEIERRLERPNPLTGLE